MYYTNFTQPIRVTFLFISLFSLIASTFSQQSSRLDSLLQELEKQEPDTNRLQTLIETGIIYMHNGSSKATEFAREALDLSTELSYPKGMGDGNQLLGHIYQGTQPDSALFHYLEAVEHYQMSGHIRRSIDMCYFIANMYTDMSNFEQAKKYHDQGFELAEKLKDPLFLMRVRNGLGVYYNSLAVYHEKRQDTLLAIENYQKAIPLLKEAANYADSISHAHADFYRSQAYGNLAYAKTGLKEYKEALDYALATLKVYQLFGYTAAYPESYNQIANIYLRMENYQQAIDYATKSLELKIDEENLGLLSTANEVLYKAHQALGNYKEAVRFGQQMFELSNEILNKDREEQIARMQTKFDTKQLDNENQLLKKEAQLTEMNLKRQQVVIWFAAGLLVLLIALALLIYKNLVNKKRFANQVQALQSAQSRWFTNIAHELRTPLTLILGPVRQMTRNQVPAASMMDELERVQKNGEQLVGRVNEILDISRMESGKLTVHQQPEDLVVLTRQVIDSFESLARQKGISLKFSYATSPVLHIDRSKISTILTNLLSNALKFTPSGGSVSIDWEERHHSIDIKISDTGIGIPEKDLSHIFERFYQAAHADQPQSGGSGVGLALAQELARLHGGVLTVSSQENQGTTFVLSLPKSLTTETVPSSANQPTFMETEDEKVPVASVVDEHTDKPSILLVEDHPDMRRYISQLLHGHYRVTEAVDGQQALDALSEFTPDLIISDVMMPVMDGLTFAKKLKEDPKHRLTPFITLTAHANERDKLTAYRTGVDDYMVKPFDAEELLARVQNLLTNALERKKALEEALVIPEEEQVPPTHEEKMVRDLEKSVRDHLSDSSFTITSLADRAAMSESSLNRLLKKTTGLTPGQFVRDIRLQQAVYLLECHQYKTISEVVYAVGFEDTSSFTRLFKKRFGKSPTAYMEGLYQS
ncbi:MAG: ATP-binding protein [Bacteroidota bacterium]